MANFLLKRAIVDVLRSQSTGIKAGSFQIKIGEALHELMAEGIVELTGFQGDIVKLKRNHHRKTWKHWLLPFGEDYFAVLNCWDTQVREMSDAHLDQLERATTHPTETNCWWAAYHATALLKQLIREERWRRSKPADVSPRTS